MIQIVSAVFVLALSVLLPLSLFHINCCNIEDRSLFHELL